jgi:hypothetical protein
VSDEYPTAKNHFGNNLSSWAIYHHVALRQSYEDVTFSINDIFGYSFRYQILKDIKPFAAARYKPTYERIKEKLRQGTLMHADETKAKVRKHDGFVWAFTNMEEVVYAFSSTREGKTLDEMLDGFQGVLVSDFYAAYDSAACPQQKCLIHLSRDINDDLFHNPFDEDLKRLAQDFVGVLKPIVETIDRHGLKRHFLSKHKPLVKHFLTSLRAAEYTSEAAQKYKKRIQKYEHKMFTFLDYDGIPWNNNNAENAIKLFASRRRILGATSTEKGLQDYLVMLSIYQTCRHKGVGFLKFLRSGLLDLDAFVDGKVC